MTMSNNNNMIVAKNIPFLIALVYSWEFKFSVTDRMIGLIPNGFIRAKSEENDIIKNDILMFSICITCYQVKKSLIY